MNQPLSREIRTKELQAIRSNPPFYWRDVVWERNPRKPKKGIKKAKKGVNKSKRKDEKEFRKQKKDDGL